MNVTHARQEYWIWSFVLKNWKSICDHGYIIFKNFWVRLCKLSTWKVCFWTSNLVLEFLEFVHFAREVKSSLEWTLHASGILPTFGCWLERPSVRSSELNFIQHLARATIERTFQATSTFVVRPHRLSNQRCARAKTLFLANFD